MAEVQYALQIRVNPGRPSVRWKFDDDYGIRDHQATAWDDLDDAQAAGYAPEDLRVVAITPLEAPAQADQINADRAQHDHRDSDGRCGGRDQHAPHWWGPNWVFWCNGQPLTTPPGQES